MLEKNMKTDSGLNFIIKPAYIIAAMALLLTVLLTLWQEPRLSDDLFLALAAGRDAVHAHIAAPDDWSFTTHGRIWFNQNWGAGLVFYIIYYITGYNGLLVLKGLLTAIWGISLVIAVYRRGIPFTIAFVATSLTMILAISYADFRPNFITLSFIALELCILYNISDKYRRIWMIVPLIILWANIHGGFIIGIIIFCLWIMSFVFQNAIMKRKLPLNAIIHYSSSAILAVAGAGLINPYGLKNLTYFFIVTSSTWKNSTAEWSPVWASQSYGDAIGFICLIIILAVLILLRFIIIKKNSRFSELITRIMNSAKLDLMLFESAASFLLILMALFSRRFIPPALIVLTFILAQQILWLAGQKPGRYAFALIILITFIYSTYNLVYIDQYLYYRDNEKKMAR
jgi:hypothetical protein